MFITTQKEHHCSICRLKVSKKNYDAYADNCILEFEEGFLDWLHSFYPDIDISWYKGWEYPERCKYCNKIKDVKDFEEHKYCNGCINYFKENRYLTVTHTYDE